MLKTYKLHWDDGKTEVVKGVNPSDALTHAGHSGSEVCHLTSYEEIG